MKVMRKKSNLKKEIWMMKNMKIKTWRKKKKELIIIQNIIIKMKKIIVNLMMRKNNMKNMKIMMPIMII